LFAIRVNAGPPMIRIAITPAAFEAVSATRPMREINSF
jgi:hypothetical protein